MLKKMMLAIAASALLSASIGAVLASGSDNIGSSAQNGEARLYNQGKGVVARQITCDSCPMAGKALDKSSAMELINGKIAPNLSREDKAAVDVYLKRRFKL